MAQNEKQWHQRFLKYMEPIVKDPSYKGLPIKKKPDGSYAWIATAKSDVGQQRIDWCITKAQELDFVVEVVRRNEEWQNKLATKIQLYVDFMENFTKNEAGFLEIPQLLFVGEDVGHLAEIFRVIKQITNYLEDDKVFFTTDLKQLDETLENTISVFGQDPQTKKYKLNTLSLDILKIGNNDTDSNELKAETKFNPNMIIE